MLKRAQKDNVALKSCLLEQFQNYKIISKY